MRYGKRYGCQHVVVFSMFSVAHTTQCGRVFIYWTQYQYIVELKQRCPCNLAYSIKILRYAAVDERNTLILWQTYYHRQQPHILLHDISRGVVVHVHAHLQAGTRATPTRWSTGMECVLATHPSSTTTYTRTGVTLSRCRCRRRCSAHDCPGA